MVIFFLIFILKRLFVSRDVLFIEDNFPLKLADSPSLIAVKDVSCESNSFDSDIDLEHTPLSPLADAIHPQDFGNSFNSFSNSPSSILLNNSSLAISPILPLSNYE